MRLLLAALALLFSASVCAAPVTPFGGGTGIANSNASTVTINGAFSLAVTLTAPSALTLPTSGTVLSTTNPINVGSNAITGGAGSFTTLATSGVTTHSAPVVINTGVDTIGVSAFNITKTWNNAAVVFPGSTISVTDTASAAGSNLLTVSSGPAGTTPRFTIDRVGSFILSGSGPHVIGTNLDNNSMLTIGGTFAGAGGSNGPQVIPLLAVPVNTDVIGFHVNPTVIEAASGTHANVRMMVVKGSITPGAANVTNFVGLDLQGANLAATTSVATTLRVSNPAGAVLGRSLWVTAGATSLDGTVTLPGLSTSSAATTGTLCWTTGTGNVNVDATTTCLLSSKKYKEEERPLDSGLKQVLALRPVSYQLRSEYNPTGLGEQIGFFAEDVAKVDPRLVSFDSDDGTPHAVRYQQITALLARAIQQQHEIYTSKIEELEKRIERLEASMLRMATIH
jgi:hypothetical protein